MRRREVIDLLAGAAGGWPSAVRAQQPERPRRIGVVIQGDTYHVGVDGLREGLKALGTEEGSLFALLVRDAKGSLPAIGAAEVTPPRLASSIPSRDREGGLPAFTA